MIVGLGYITADANRPGAPGFLKFRWSEEYNIQKFVVVLLHAFNLGHQEHLFSI